MTDKSHENNFKFVLYQGQNIIMERIFSADNFNPVIRYSVDIRDMIPSIIQRLQKTLSRRNLTHDEYGYNFLNYYLDQTNEMTKMGHTYFNKLEKPEIIKQNFGRKSVRGVECKFGLYINENPIVERNFYVDNYNPASRFSTEILDVVNEISNEINESLKNNDVTHMWDDYTLINTYGLYINQIRDLSDKRRKDMLKNIDNRSYVKKQKSYIRKSTS